MLIAKPLSRRGTFATRESRLGWTSDDGPPDRGSMMVAPILYGDRALGVVVASNRPGRSRVRSGRSRHALGHGQPVRHLDRGCGHARAAPCCARRARRSSRPTHPELQGSEERYRRITETITDFVFTVTVRDGRASSTALRPGLRRGDGLLIGRDVAGPLSVAAHDRPGGPRGGPRADSPDRGGRTGGPAGASDRPQGRPRSGGSATHRVPQFGPTAGSLLHTTGSSRT